MCPVGALADGSAGPARLVATAGGSITCIAVGVVLAGSVASAVAVIWSWRSSASITIRSSAASTSSCAARWIADSGGGAALICERLRSRASRRCCLRSILACRRSRTSSRFVHPARVTPREPRPFCPASPASRAGRAASAASRLKPFGRARRRRSHRDAASAGTVFPARHASGRPQPRWRVADRPTCNQRWEPTTVHLSSRRRQRQWPLCGRSGSLARAGGVIPAPVIRARGRGPG